MYLLTMYQKIIFGPLDKPENRDPHVKDIHGREIWVFGTIVPGGASCWASTPSPSSSAPSRR